jgi:hypothetical protein
MLLDLDAVIRIVASAPREQRKGMESTPRGETVHLVKSSNRSQRSEAALQTSIWSTS